MIKKLIYLSFFSPKDFTFLPEEVVSGYWNFASGPKTPWELHGYTNWILNVFVLIITKSIKRAGNTIGP